MTINDEPESDLKLNNTGFGLSNQEKAVIAMTVVFVSFFLGILVGKFWL